MPAIDRDQLNCSVYLYPSAESARDGANAGGSGFLIGLSTGVEDYEHVYVVTNKHVIDGGNHTLRLNTPHGGFDTLDSKPDDWTVATDDDLAVLGLDVSERFLWDRIHESQFAKEEDFRVRTGAFDTPFGHGDDVIFIGRLISHDGKVRNRPAVRFGNISMLPDAADPVAMPFGGQVAFLVDCRSLPGASGSAAIAYLASARPGGVSLIGAGRGILLGIDCGHLPRWATVYEGDRSTKTGQLVEMNSGISVVIPAWRLRGLLDTDPLVSARKSDEQKLRERLSNHNSAATPETKSNP